jgi:hypothetical protein
MIFTFSQRDQITVHQPISGGRRIFFVQTMKSLVILIPFCFFFFFFKLAEKFI